MNIKSLPNELLWRISANMGQEHDIRRDIRERMAEYIRKTPGAIFQPDHEEKLYQQNLQMLKDGMVLPPSTAFDDLLQAIHGRPK